MVKQKVTTLYLEAINQHLDEPIQDCLALDGNGQPCVEIKSPVDLETKLGMIGGNIFHTNLSWPFAQKSLPEGTWGVETKHPNIFVCGSSAERGGCVSGIPGHNAARKVINQSVQ